MSACSVPDRYLPKLLPGETIARVRGVVALAVGPKHATYYALANGEVYSLAIRPTKLIAHFTTTRLDSIAFSPNGLLYAAFLSAQGVSVAAWKDGASDTVIETTVEAKGEIAFDTDGRLLLGIGDRIIDTQGQVISDGWRAPQVVPGRGHRLWVADNAPGDDKELVARGREKSVVKRRRFASALPLRTDPSDLALLKDELLVCSEHYGTVYRLHIGLDDVARRRSALKNVKCRNAIVISPDNSVITATEDAILRYGAR
jgi:hypothetical protein